MTAERLLPRVLIGVFLTLIVLLIAQTGHGGPAADDTPRLTPNTSTVIVMSQTSDGSVFSCGTMPYDEFTDAEDGRRCTHPTSRENP